MLNATERIEHTLGVGIGIKRDQGCIAAERCIRRIEPVACGDEIVKHFTRAPQSIASSS